MHLFHIPQYSIQNRNVHIPLQIIQTLELIAMELYKGRYIFF